MKQKTEGFEDLKVWQLARKIKKEIFNLCREFPIDEKFCLVSQIKRAAISVTANIAEGYGRYHYQENIQFCRIARGSINELIDHFYTAVDEGYIEKYKFEFLHSLLREVEKVLNGYISYLQRRL